MKIFALVARLVHRWLLLRPYLGPAALFALGLLVAVAFVPGWLSPAAAPRWVLLSLALPIALLFVRARWTAAHAALVAFLLYAALSLLWTPELSAGLQWLSRFSILAGAFALGSSLGSVRPMLCGIGVGLVPSLLTLAPAGLFFNPQMLAEVAAPILAFAVLAGGAWIALAFVAAAALVLAGQFAPPLAAAVALTWFGLPRLRWAVLPLCAVPFLLPAWAPVANRLELWSDALHLLTPFGVGIGAFAASFAALPSHAAHEFAQGVAIDFAHNEPLQFAVELGVGTLLLMPILARALRGPHDVAERAALVALLGCAAVAFPFHDPAAGFVGATVAGWLCRARPAAGDDDGGRRDLRGSRGGVG